MAASNVLSHNVFVGSETGLLKGVHTSKYKVENLNQLKHLTREYEITSMCWKGLAEKELYFGLRNQTVNVFNTKKQTITNTIHVNGGEGPLQGVASCSGRLVTCSESGHLSLWNSEGQSEISFNAGQDVCRMRQNQNAVNIVATGGKENELKIWDLKRTENPIFTAKNVRNDFLDLRVPVWIYDIAFMPNSEKVVTVTGHHQIRLYDLSLRQRRPAADMEFDEYPITSLSLAHRENQIVIGNARGRMALIDLRKKAMVHTFKGFAGSIRSVECHPTQPLVASCGLDRFLKIHDLNTQKLLFKMYLKSRLNCLLMRKKDFVLKEDPKEKIEKKRKEKSDEMWNHIDLVSDDDTSDIQIEPANNENILNRKTTKKKKVER